MSGLSLGYGEQPYLFDELDKMVAYAPICDGDCLRAFGRSVQRKGSECSVPGLVFSCL